MIPHYSYRPIHTRSMSKPGRGIRQQGSMEAPQSEGLDDIEEVYNGIMLGYGLRPESDGSLGPEGEGGMPISRTRTIP